MLLSKLLAYIIGDQIKQAVIELLATQNSRGSINDTFIGLIKVMSYIKFVLRSMQIDSNQSCPVLSVSIKLLLSRIDIAQIILVAYEALHSMST